MHNVQHVFGLNDHLPSARDIPKLCKVLGNEIILECMYGKARRQGNRMPLRRLTVPRL